MTRAGKGGGEFFRVVGNLDEAAVLEGLGDLELMIVIDFPQVVPAGHGDALGTLRAEL